MEIFSKHNLLVFDVRGALGDELCCEPVIRYNQECCRERYSYPMRVSRPLSGVNYASPGNQQ